MSAARDSSGSGRPASDRSRDPVLNERQQTYLDVLYAIDQDNEHAQQRRWHAQHEHLPAEQWRWITYGIQHPAAEPTYAQQQLSRHGILDSGAGATLAALGRRSLIETRQCLLEGPAGPVWHLQVRLTRAGRAAARAHRTAPVGQPDGQLPPWLHAALLIVAAHHPHEAAQTTISRVAARRLTTGKHRYIEAASAWTYRLTPAGHHYLALTEQPATDASPSTEG